MKTVFNILAVAILLAVTSNPCYALWFTEIISQERAKELGMEVRSTAAGRNQIHLELEFTAKGELKEFSHIDLRFDKGALRAPLKEDRSKPSRIVVRFTTDRAQLGKLNLCVMVPGLDGGNIYDLPVKDFVELKTRDANTDRRGAGQ